MMLTVSDIERLAKAGVEVKLTDVINNLMPDNMSVGIVPTPPRLEDEWPTDLTKSFWQRWRRANPREFGDGQLPPYRVYPHEFKDIVYVMIAPQEQAPFIVEDVALLYPSDALMAKLAFLEKAR